MNWYRCAQNNDRLTQVLTSWLRRAYSGPVDVSLIQQDIEIAMGIIDIYKLEQSLQAAEASVKKQTGQAILLPSQQQVVDEITRLFQFPTEEMQ